MNQGSSLVPTRFVSFYCWIKHHDQKQLTEEFVWAYGSRRTRVQHSREVWQQAVSEHWPGTGSWELRSWTQTCSSERVVEVTGDSKPTPGDTSSGKTAPSKPSHSNQHTAESFLKRLTPSTVVWCAILEPDSEDSGTRKWPCTQRSLKALVFSHPSVGKSLTDAGRADKGKVEERKEGMRSKIKNKQPWSGK